MISAGLAVNLWPSLAHFGHSGAAVAIRRQASDADQYALRIAQVVLPVSGHRLFALEALKTEYNRRPMINENDVFVDTAWPHAPIGIVHMSADTKQGEWTARLMDGGSRSVELRRRRTESTFSNFRSPEARTS